VPSGLAAGGATKVLGRYEEASWETRRGTVWQGKENTARKTAKITTGWRTCGIGEQVPRKLKHSTQNYSSQQELE
jgi:hypothetical protein